MLVPVPIDSQTTLAQIATHYPDTIKWFVKNGWDFCCGGFHDLEWACKAHNMSLSAFQDAIAPYIQRDASSGCEGPWTANRLGELIDHILQAFHQPHREAFSVLRPLASKVAEVHGEKRPQWVELRDELEKLFSELEMHMMKEEKVLFPTIRTFTGGAAEGPVLGRQQSLFAIKAMKSEHEDAGLTLERLRWLTDGFEKPEDACATVTALYDQLEAFTHELLQHIHLENNLLFPIFEDLEYSMS